jgi:HRDC domain-containing protein
MFSTLCPVFLISLSLASAAVEAPCAWRGDVGEQHAGAVVIRSDRIAEDFHGRRRSSSTAAGVKLDHFADGTAGAPLERCCDDCGLLDWLPDPETIAAIAAARPQDEDALLAIHGVGPAFIEKYAAECWRSSPSTPGRLPPEAR